MNKYKYLIVGGGMTADAAVKGIRRVDESGTIGIVTAEKDPPYARPPLSKDLWAGKKSVDDIWCNTEKKGAEVVLNRRIVSIDIAAQEALDSAGDKYGYRQLLLATGGRPRQLSIDNGEIVYFRTLEDYRRLHSLAEQKEHFAVFGGGFIGAEISAALNGNGNKVTMVFPEAAVCGLTLPSNFASRLNHYYEEHGVNIVAGCKPSEINIDKDVSVVSLENGHKFSVDGIVAGIGIEPDADLAEQNNIKVDDGIIVDEFLRTSAPDVFAAGDVAEFYSPALDRRLRVEHEDSALHMGETAGRNMAGERVPYRHMPFFYSDLFDVGYEAVGEVDSSLETYSHLQEPEEKGCIFYLKGDYVRGVMFWNLFGKVDAGRELIASSAIQSKLDLERWAKERLAE